MLKQLDNDRNIVLVLSPAEYGRASEVLVAALDSLSVGLSHMTPEAWTVMQELSAAGYMLTDEELVEGLLSPHRNHDGDDLEKLEAHYIEGVQKGRAKAIENGLA